MSIDLLPAGWNNVGHDNRVFAVKFIDENTLISGGWDSVVHIWDLRQGKSARHFYGPNISGESLDYENGMILAGCYAAQKQVQVYDVKSLKKVEEIDWSGDIDDAEYLYCASFNRRDPTYFGAGSTGPNSEVRLYRESEDNPARHDLVADIKGLNQGCFSLDFSNRLDQFAFSTPHHGLYVYEYKRSE
jgi:COMPASS component SWD3